MCRSPPCCDRRGLGQYVLLRLPHRYHPVESFAKIEYKRKRIYDDAFPYAERGKKQNALRYKNRSRVFRRRRSLIPYRSRIDIASARRSLCERSRPRRHRLVGSGSGRCDVYAPRSRFARNTFILRSRRNALRAYRIRSRLCGLRRTFVVADKAARIPCKKIRIRLSRKKRCCGKKTAYGFKRKRKTLSAYRSRKSARVARRFYRIPCKGQAFLLSRLRTKRSRKKRRRFAHAAPDVQEMRFVRHDLYVVDGFKRRTRLRQNLFCRRV